MSYTYGQAGPGCTHTPGPHATSRVVGGGTITYCYDRAGNRIASNGAGLNRQVAYNRQNQARAITTPETTLAFGYSVSGEWVLKRQSTDQGTELSFYLATGKLEIDETGNRVFHRTIAGVAIVKRYEASQTDTIAYRHTDHLGSVSVLTGQTGEIITRSAFTAFGKRRAVSDYRAFPDPEILDETKAWTDQGFTGHEMADSVGLIHMGGRLYDPALGRFVSPDPFVQAPGWTQSFNRYSYVFNNPLKYTDPTGYLTSGDWIKIVATAVVSYATFGAATAPGVGFFEGAGIVAASGFVTGYVATGTTQGAFTSAVLAGITYGFARSGTAAIEGASASGGAASTGTVANPSQVAQAEGAAAIAQAPLAASGGGYAGNIVQLPSISARLPWMPASSMLVDLAQGAFSSLNAARTSYNWLVDGKNANGVDIAAGVDRASLRAAKQRLLAFIGGPARMAQLNEAARIMALASNAAKFFDFAATMAAGGVFGGLRSSTLAARHAYHYTNAGFLGSIRSQGLRAGSYATNTSKLSPLQAQIDLALRPNRGLTNAVIRVDLGGLRRAGYRIPPLSRVGRSFGMPGGGYEMRFTYPIPPEFLKVIQP